MTMQNEPPTDGVPAPNKLTFKSFMSLGTVALVVVVVVLGIRAETQRAIAKTFLDSVTMGDKAAAESLSDGVVRTSVRACVGGPCDATPSGHALLVLRGSLTNSVSMNVTTSWNARCVVATARQRVGGSVELFLRIELRGEAWLVTGISQSRDDLGVTCDNG
jgi:hypothetical protein